MLCVVLAQFRTNMNYDMARSIHNTQSSHVLPWEWIIRILCNHMKNWYNNRRKYQERAEESRHVFQNKNWNNKLIGMWRDSGQAGVSYYVCMYLSIEAKGDIMDMWGSTLENTEATIAELIKIMKLQSNRERLPPPKINATAIIYSYY